MAKNRRNHMRAAPPQPAQRRTSAERRERAADLEQAASVAADRADLEKAAKAEGVDLATVTARPSAEAPPASTSELEERLLKTFDALREQKAGYEECAKRARELEERAAEELRRAAAAAETHRSDQEELARDREKLDAKATALQQLSLKLDEREKAVAARELEADAGFPTRRAAAEEALKAELAHRREQAEADLRTAREANNATLAVQRQVLADEQAAFAAHVSEQAAELNRQRQSLADEQAKLTDELARVHRERISVERRERQVDEEVRVQTAATVQLLEGELHVAQAEAAAANEIVTRLTGELTELRSRWAAVGIEDPRGILADLARAEQENKELHDKLAARLDDDSLDRLRQLEQQNREVNAERERLEYELQEERGRLLADRINQLQVTQLADAQQQFDIIKRGYEMRIAELSGTLSELVNGRADPTEPLFPNCVALDDDLRLQEAGHLVDDEVPDLHQLACALQGKMWRQTRRAYFLDDVCGVLGGLAMSQLHLLEGRSGIGKTSLPKALAAALGTECVIIEVQAGWRDRYDLFGHYNTFERRFQEEQFLIALYKSQTPRYRDRPFFIVLDEMNLARPEQYFSVLLSRMESRDTEPIKLAPVSTGRKPQWMDESGTGIRLPDNVWFVGTANQDESTLEFADKTYNRAYVLELPAQRPFVPREGQVEPYSIKALRRAFEEARGKHGPELKVVKDLLTDLAEDLYDVGRVQVDPRVEMQLDRYVPVVVAARGTDEVNETRAGDFKVAGPAGKFNPVALAADQFIASKVLHQLRSRFEVTTNGIHQLEQSLDLYWTERFGTIVPGRCRKVFADERRRRNA